MKILLKAWAAKHFDPVPSINTLRGWANTGQIVPKPEKVGRSWYVEEDAVYKKLEATEGGQLSERAKAILHAA